MSDLVVSSVKKINILDRIIQNVVIMVNMSKMNRAIDEHLMVIKNTEREEQRLYQENILREIVYVKYQYDIMQRNMYELKISYANHIIDNINSMDKTERLLLQKEFLEMEYDRVTKIKLKSKDDIKYMLLLISSVIATVKQNIKDEGKNQKYNLVIKCAEEVDNKILDASYTEICYVQTFKYLDEYVSYINDNYDISKLPADEKEIIEIVIEATINPIESDIDKLNYEYDLMNNICKNSYRYFKIVDKIFEKLQKVYDESLERESINVKDYIKFYEEIYDKKIKIMVNDVHRSIKIEDEYLEYSKMLAENKDVSDFLIKKALDTSSTDNVKDILSKQIIQNVEDTVEQMNVAESQETEENQE